MSDFRARILATPNMDAASEYPTESDVNKEVRGYEGGHYDARITAAAIAAEADQAIAELVEALEESDCPYPDGTLPYLPTVRKCRSLRHCTCDQGEVLAKHKDP